MEFKNIGKSGLKITSLTFGSALTIGTENNTIEYAQSLVDAAWENGIRSFDTSNNYGNGNAEILLGNALKKYPRHQYVLSTKGSWPIGDSVYEKGLSRKHIFWAVSESLRRLEVDYIDVYYAHRFDDSTPMVEIVRTFNYLISTGKILYWATSEWPLEAIRECIKVCDELKLEKPIAEQFIYSFAVQKSVKNGVYNFCMDSGIGTLCFSPLCQGYLTGKYKDGIPKDSRIDKANKLNYHKTSNFYSQNKNRIDGFIEICDKFELSYTAVALQWCLRKNILPVFGASTIEQINYNCNSITLPISEECWAELENISGD